MTFCQSEAKREQHKSQRMSNPVATVFFFCSKNFFIHSFPGSTGDEELMRVCVCVHGCVLLCSATEPPHKPIPLGLPTHKGGFVAPDGADKPKCGAPRTHWPPVFSLWAATTFTRCTQTSVSVDQPPPRPDCSSSCCTDSLAKWSPPCSCCHSHAADIFLSTVSRKWLGFFHSLRWKWRSWFPLLLSPPLTTSPLLRLVPGESKTWQLTVVPLKLSLAATHWAAMEEWMCRLVTDAEEESSRLE